MNNPKIRVNRGNIGNEIWISLPDLSALEKTFLDADAAASSTSMTVISGTNFSANQYVVVGIPGTEGAEIKKLSSVAATSLGIAALTNSHVQGTPVYFIPFDQIELYSATAVGGSYSLDSTVSIRSDALETFIQKAADASSKAYKVRFKNSNDSTYSDYSDEVTGSGYSSNTVWAIKHRALDQLDERIEGAITDSFLDESLWEARREIDSMRKRWSWRTSFNSTMGNISEGQWSIAVPTTLRDQNSNQNLLGIRFGKYGRNMSYEQKRDFDRWYMNTRHTTCSAATAGATSITLSNCRDFDDSGSIKIGSQTITYTSKTNSSGVLSGIPSSGDGSITDNIAASTDVWQNVSFGVATIYTIWEGYIYFNLPFNSDLEGSNVIGDWYRTLVEKDSDSDTVDEPDYDALVSYLKYKIKDKQKKGTVNKSKDPDYLDYTRRVGLMMNREVLGQEPQLVPDIAHLIDQE